MSKNDKILWRYWSWTILAVFATAPLGVASDADFKLAGTVDLPADTLVLPVAADVSITVFVGGPEGPPVTVVLTPATQFEFEEDEPSSELRDDDRVKVEGNMVGDSLVVTDLEIEEFAELKLAGSVTVGGSLELPVTVDTTIDIAVGGETGPVLSVILTPDTQVEFEEVDGPFVLHDGDFVEAEVVIRGGELIVDEIEIEEFAEAKIRGTVSGLSDPLSLPVGSDTTVTIFVGGLATAALDVVIKPDTVIEDDLTLLANGDSVEVEVIVRSGMLEVTELESADF